MIVYSYSEARQQLAELLNRARREGQVEIRRRDGEVFIVRPTARSGSPLDVPGVDARLGREELVDLVRESRRSGERFFKKTASRKTLHRSSARPSSNAKTRRKTRRRS